LANFISLPNILEKFQRQNICSGLGNINVHYISDQSAFRDYVDEWRVNECSLLSQRKTCDCCVKLKRKILRNEKMLKSTKRYKTINRTLRSSNPLEVKLKVMRKTLKRRTRDRYRAKSRVKLLLNSLKNKQAEIAAM